MIEEIDHNQKFRIHDDIIMLNFYQNYKDSMRLQHQPFYTKNDVRIQNECKEPCVTYGIYGHLLYSINKNYIVEENYDYLLLNRCKYMYEPNLKNCY